MIKRFILMIQFFTRIPVPVNVDAKPEDFGRGLAFAPLVGLFIGGLLCGVFTLVSLVFPSFICSALVIAAYAVITGGLHFDGLGDTFDGVFSNRSKERIFEIMKDSRVGTNAVLVLIFVILMDILSLTYINQYHSVSFPIFCILFMPVSGRIGSAIGAGLHRYARNDDGLGRYFVDHCSKKEMLISIFLYIIVFLISSIISGVFKNSALMLVALVCAFAAIICAVLTSCYFAMKLGGVTGDILGAVCEINQLIFLMLSAAFQYVFI